MSQLVFVGRKFLWKEAISTEWSWNLYGEVKRREKVYKYNGKKKEKQRENIRKKKKEELTEKFRTKSIDQYFVRYPVLEKNLKTIIRIRLHHIGLVVTYIY